MERFVLVQDDRKTLGKKFVDLLGLNLYNDETFGYEYLCIYTGIEKCLQGGRDGAIRFNLETQWDEAVDYVCRYFNLNNLVYVLKPEFENNREVFDFVEKITGLIDLSHLRNIRITEPTHIEKLRKLGVLNIWFEVEKIKTITKKFGDVEFTIEPNKKITTQYGEVKIKEIIAILNWWENSPAKLLGYDIKVENVKIGCQIGTFQELLEIKKAYYKQ